MAGSNNMLPVCHLTVCRPLDARLSEVFTRSSSSLSRSVMVCVQSRPRSWAEGRGRIQIHEVSDLSDPRVET